MVDAQNIALRQTVEEDLREPIAQLGHADLRDRLVGERVNQHSSGGTLFDSPGLEIEKLAVLKLGKILLPFQRSWPEIGLPKFVMFSYVGKPVS